MFQDYLAIFPIRLYTLRVPRKFLYYQNQQQLEDHIRIYHKNSPFAEYLQEIVYGGSDGIVTTLAVIAGFTGAGAGNNGLTVAAVVLFGLANLFADGTSMGLGDYLSMRSSNAFLKRQMKKQELEIFCDEEMAMKETQFLLQRDGFDEKTSKDMLMSMKKNKTFWRKYMLSREIGVAEEESNPSMSAIFTFFSFIFFGFIPLIPYVFGLTSYQFVYSITGAAAALCMLGLVRAYNTDEKWYRAIGETLLVGGLSASVAFLVGTLFDS